MWFTNDRVLLSSSTILLFPFILLIWTTLLVIFNKIEFYRREPEA
jgi:hypothetical protein